MNRSTNIICNYSGIGLPVLFLAGILLFAISGCDKITDPIIGKTTYSALPTTTPDHVTKTTDSTITKVLLEDYMGHFCVNCATAVQTATSLEGPQVVSMEVNVGYFADVPGESGAPLLPSGIPPACDTAYDVDYTTTAGNAWGLQFLNGDGNLMPQGMVNRIYYDGSNYDEDLQFSGWGTVVDSIIATPQTAAITMVDSCWIKQQIFGTAVTVSLKDAPAAGYTYYLQMAVVEDSVEDWQSTPSGAQQYFIHHYVLRSAINGSWGDAITFTGANAPVTKYYTYTNTSFRFNSATITNPPQVPARLWNMAHCYVIAFLYQQANNGVGPRDYYVLQAQKLHL